MTATASVIEPEVPEQRQASWPQVRIVPDDPFDLSALAGFTLGDSDSPWESLAQVRPINGDLDVAELRRRFALIRLTSKCIEELREVGSVRQLIELAPKMVCRLGFDRAMVSKVAESVWTVERTHSDNDPEGTESLAARARRLPQRVASSMLEAEMIRRRIPLLVADAQRDPRVHRGFAAATGSRSYVAAPIMPAGKVIGFLHADRFNQGADVDEFDREVLSHFAEQFGRVLERTILLERFENLRRTVEGLTDSLGGMVGACVRNAVEMPSGDTETGAVALAPVPSLPAPVKQHPDCILTKREIDVLELMATGYTNARIAAGLVISEGTVKSHVKHILRKLSAANRAEAVSRWLQRPATS